MHMVVHLAAANTRQRAGVPYIAHRCRSCWRRFDADHLRHVPSGHRHGHIAHLRHAVIRQYSQWLAVAPPVVHPRERIAQRPTRPPSANRCRPKNFTPCRIPSGLYLDRSCRSPCQRIARFWRSARYPVAVARDGAQMSPNF